jgi:hypothetical protein
MKPTMTTSKTVLHRPSIIWPACYWPHHWLFRKSAASFSRLVLLPLSSSGLSSLLWECSWSSSWSFETDVSSGTSKVLGNQLCKTPLKSYDRLVDTKPYWKFTNIKTSYWKSTSNLKTRVPCCRISAATHTSLQKFESSSVIMVAVNVRQF